MPEPCACRLIVAAANQSSYSCSLVGKKLTQKVTSKITGSSGQQDMAVGVARDEFTLKIRVNTLFIDGDLWTQCFFTLTLDRCLNFKIMSIFSREIADNCTQIVGSGSAAKSKV